MSEVGDVSDMGGSRVRATRFARAEFARFVAPHFAWPTWALAGAVFAAMAVALRAGLGLTAGEPICWLARIAHVSCPTCGLTRSLTLLARGDLAGSLAMHPWGLALTVQLVAAWLVWGAWLAAPYRERPDRWIPRAIAFNAIALGVIWVARLATGSLP